jgi:hypothetical protein
LTTACATVGRIFDFGDAESIVMAVVVRMIALLENK